MQLPLFKSDPVLALNNIEFLCLKMHAHPGMPARWYLRALHQYRFGTPGVGSWNSMYFRIGYGYRGRLFRDTAPKIRPARGAAIRSCSAVGSFVLSEEGKSYAARAAAKIGIAL
jgi:hypothetical protein